MKPLTKTTVNRGGGIAARFALEDEKPKKAKVANAKPVANKPVANVANPKPRYARWREANPDLYKQRQAALMRKRRAKEREASK